MGPDEFAAREELGLVFRFLVAKQQQTAEFISLIAAKLTAKGTLTVEDFQALTADLEHSRYAEKAKKADAALRDLLTIRNIVREYLDPETE